MGKIQVLCKKFGNLKWLKRINCSVFSVFVQENSIRVCYNKAKFTWQGGSL